VIPELVFLVVTSTSACDGLCADWRTEARAWEQIAQAKQIELDSVSPIKLEVTWWLAAIALVAGLAGGYTVANLGRSSE
jgi:hypothetical protein